MDIPQDILSQESVQQLTVEYFGIELKDKQWEALDILLNKRKDLILIAKTGFGKSVIFQLLPLLFSPHRTALILMPLNALLEEQCEKLSHIPGCQPFVLNGESNNAMNIHAIRAGHFTHVFTSPEIAIKTEFNDDVLRHSSFSNRLCLLAIDEAHLNEWKTFRPAYFGLNVLRTRIPPWIPLLGVSVTLRNQTVDVIRERCDFAPDTIIIKTPLDRPEIYLQVSSIRNPINSMLDLQHLLPAQIMKAQDIPKTIVFMDSIADIVTAARLMRIWMNQLSYPLDVNPLVSPFFSPMAERDKKAAQVKFGLPTTECLSPRIIIATDAYGMGVDNRDVERVVQWLIPPSMEKLYQRMGRAMRCGRGQANFTWLHPPWCVGPKSAAGTIETGANRADADRRARMAPGLYDIINVPDQGCVRCIGLDFFNATEHLQEDWTKPFPCCSVCDPDIQTSITPHTGLNKTPEENSLGRPWFTAKLEAWRIERAETVFENSYLRFFPSLILPDEALTNLATWGEYIKDEASMRRWVSSGWAGLSIYCDQILPILRQGQALDKDRGEVFDAWALRNDIKRGRCPNPLFNEEKPISMRAEQVG